MTCTNETQTEKLEKKTTEHFTLSTTYVHAVVGNLSNTVEDYRLQQIDGNKSKRNTNIPTLNKGKTDEAEAFLKQLNLLQQTKDCIRKSGVIGGEVNRLISHCNSSKIRPLDN